MNLFGKFPLVRMKQFITNPGYFYFWVCRFLYYKQSSFSYLPKYRDYVPLNPKETLEHIISENLSVARFGDGEFGILSGAGIYPPDSDWSQRYSTELKNRLEEVMLAKEPKLIQAFPSRRLIFANKKEARKEKMISSMHTELRLFLWRYIRPNQTYGDWGVFTLQHHKDLNWNRLYTFLEHKTVVIVTGNTAALSHLILGQKTLFVEAGKHDAFERYVDIKMSIERLIEDQNLDKANTLIMASIGPTADILVLDLTKKGYMVWDTGHFFRYANDALTKFSNYEKA